MADAEVVQAYGCGPYFRGFESPPSPQVARETPGSGLTRIDSKYLVVCRIELDLGADLPYPLHFEAGGPDLAIPSDLGGSSLLSQRQDPDR